MTDWRARWSFFTPAFELNHDYAGKTYYLKKLKCTLP
jgi:hypothetical protein